MDNAHALIESIRSAPPNVSVVVRIAGRVFAFRWVSGKLVYRVLRQEPTAGVGFAEPGTQGD